MFSVQLLGNWRILLLKILETSRGLLNILTSTPSKIILCYVGINWANENMYDGDDFEKKFFSHEAYFRYSGLISKIAVFATQKTHTWSYKRLFGVTCGPYFFDNEDDATIRVNGDNYRTIITDFCLYPLY